MRVAALRGLPDPARITPMPQQSACQPFRRWGKVLILLLGICVLLPAAVRAQTGIGGWPIEMSGMVQVEPGPNVLTFAVKDEEIRFVVHDILSTDRDFTMTRLLAEVRYRSPSLFIKGAEPVLEVLLTEKPGKRALKLRGIVYPESRQFVVHSIKPFTAAAPPQQQF
ncbi:MAG: hypothetical protein NZ578_03785 [Candidatus Binatia bacterium]|nr:hypothetical protein [Candidatus Binatia bacterium]